MDYYTCSHISNFIVVINCNLDYFISEALNELYIKMKIQSSHRKLIALISTAIWTTALHDGFAILGEGLRGEL